MKLLVYGSLEFGRVLRELVISCGHEFVGFIDDFHGGEAVVGTYAEASQRYPSDAYGIVIGIGYNNLAARLGIYRKVRSDGYSSPTLIHNQACVHQSATIGDGSIIMSGAIIDVFSILGDIVVMWPGAVVNHDSTIGSNTFISPNATICGFVRVGGNCFIGAGAVVVDHRVVPDETFVKAGVVFS